MGSSWFPLSLLIVLPFRKIYFLCQSLLQRRYYHNITFNTLVVLEAMAVHGVQTLIYSSTCATYGEPEQMPITEDTAQVRTAAVTHVHIQRCKCQLNCNAFFFTKQVPINPYGKAKKMAEDIILDFHKNSDMAVMILRLVFIVYDSM